MKDEEKNEEIVLESPDHINGTCPTSLSPEPRYPEKGKRQVRDDLALARQLPESDSCKRRVNTNFFLQRNFGSGVF